MDCRSSSYNYRYAILEIAFSIHNHSPHAAQFEGSEPLWLYHQVIIMVLHPHEIVFITNKFTLIEHCTATWVVEQVWQTRRLPDQCLLYGTRKANRCNLIGPKFPKFSTLRADNQLLGR